MCLLVHSGRNKSLYFSLISGAFQGSRLENKKLESIECFIEDQAPSSYDWAPSPLSHQQAWSATNRKIKKERQLADGREDLVRQDKNYMTARKSGPLKIIQYSLVGTQVGHWSNWRDGIFFSLATLPNLGKT